MIIFLLQKQCLCITTVLHANATIQSLLIIQTKRLEPTKFDLLQDSLLLNNN